MFIRVQFLVLIATVCFVKAARILCLYPVPFHSHQSVFLKLTEKLASQGHQIVVLAPVSFENKLPNVTLIDVKNMSYAMWDELFSKNAINLDTVTLDAELFWNLGYEAAHPILDVQLNTPEMQDLIKDENENFDLILIEADIRPAIMVNIRFKAPVIMVSSYFGLVENYHSVGAMVDPIIFPDFNIAQSWNSPLWNKLLSTYSYLRLRVLEWNIEKVENTMIRKRFGKNAPTMAELVKNVQMLLLNVHHVWDNNRPVPPNVLYLGALHLKDPQPLQNDFKQYLDSSKEGVVYVSLGSKFRSSDLPLPKIELMMKVFKALPYDFIWKWETEIPPGTSKNVRFEKWLPQNDMLYHPKLKAFVTQAGLQSTDEAIAARVPLVALPIWVDQAMNAANYEKFGIGIRLNIDNLDEEELKNAIITVAENTSYRENLDKLARLMEVERFGALDKALRWINHVATHGGHPLRPPLPDLSFVQYYMLDVISAISLIIFVIITSIVLLVKYMIKVYLR